MKRNRIEKKLQERFPNHDIKISSYDIGIAGFEDTRIRGLYDRITIIVNGDEFAVVYLHPAKESVVLKQAIEKINTIAPVR